MVSIPQCNTNPFSKAAQALGGAGGGGNQGAGEGRKRHRQRKIKVRPYGASPLYSPYIHEERGRMQGSNACVSPTYYVVITQIPCRDAGGSSIEISRYLMSFDQLDTIGKSH